MKHKKSTKKKSAWTGSVSTLSSKRKSAYKKGLIEENNNASYSADAERKAKPAGERKSKSGSIYREYRSNRSDSQKKKVPYLAKGGVLDGMNWIITGKQ